MVVDLEKPGGVPAAQLNEVVEHYHRRSTTEQLSGSAADAERMPRY